MREYKQIALLGAGGKMGMRIGANLARGSYETHYCENNADACERLATEGRPTVAIDSVIAGCDLVILAVPDIALSAVTEELVPKMSAGSTLLTLDPAAAYANVLYKRDDIRYAVAHPCHPSVFLQRHTDAEFADAFGGAAATQSVAAAFDDGSDAEKAALESVVRVMYGPVDDVHWVTVTQLAYLEPTLVETTNCMLSALLKEALDETVARTGIPRKAAEAMLYGHIQIALAVTFKGTNPFSDACMIAMDYGRESIIKPDWKKIFDQEELDKVIARMLKIDRLQRLDPVS